MAYGSSGELHVFSRHILILNRATKIVVERASLGESYNLLLRDLAGKNPGKRDKALTALKLLGKSSKLDLTCISSPTDFIAVHSRICNYATFKALIDCLCRFLANREAHPLTELDTNYAHRPQAEKAAMQLLIPTCRYKLPEAYRAGMISRWLAKYPFGGFSASEGQKREIIQRLKTGATDDHMMSMLLHAIDSDPEGRKQLRNHGLVGSAIGESPDDDNHGEPQVIENLLATEVLGRTRGESAEEHALRRRRREAMVLSEGRGPISNDDIIQRDDPMSDDDLETRSVVGEHIRDRGSEAPTGHMWPYLATIIRTATSNIDR